eukprot:5694195-Amphidinium_carterae.1
MAGQNIEQWIIEVEQYVVNCTIPTSERISFRSLLLGLYTKQHGHGVGHRTWQHLSLLQAIHRLAKSHGREYTTVQVNVSVASEQRGPLRLHRDYFNLKGYDNMIMVMGSYRGGRLWVQTDKQNDDVVPPQLLQPQQCHDDFFLKMRGRWITPRRGQWLVLDATKHHAVEEVSEGVRISVVTYCPSGLTRVGLDVWKKLQDLKFPCRRLQELSDEETSWWWHYWHRERENQPKPLLKAGRVMGETVLYHTDVGQGAHAFLLEMGHQARHAHLHDLDNMAMGDDKAVSDESIVFYEANCIDGFMGMDNEYS